MNPLAADTPPLIVWHTAPATPIGVPLTVLDDATGKALTGTDLTSLTGKLAVMADGTVPSGVDTADWASFTWVTWTDPVGQPTPVAHITVGPSGDLDWPADSGLMRVWWQLTTGEAGLAAGTIDLR